MEPPAEFFAATVVVEFVLVFSIARGVASLLFAHETAVAVGADVLLAFYWRLRARVMANVRTHGYF